MLRRQSVNIQRKRISQSNYICFILLPFFIFRNIFLPFRFVSTRLFMSSELVSMLLFHFLYITEHLSLFFIHLRRDSTLQQIFFLFYIFFNRSLYHTGLYINK